MTLNPPGAVASNLRGTANTAVPCSDAIALDPPTAKVARLSGLSSVDLKALEADQFREAATYLGRLYRAFEAKELGDWALPNRLSLTGDPIVSPQLDRATAKIFGAGVDFDDRFRRYEKYFDTVIPEVKRSAGAWAQKTLQTQIEMLSTLRTEIATPSFSLWMYQAAQEIWSASASCREAERARILSELRAAYAGAPPTSAQDSKSPDLGLEKSIYTCVVAATRSFIEPGGRREPEPAYDYVRPKNSELELLTIFLIHPRYVELVEAYRSGPSEGTKFSQRLFQEAVDATRRFSDSMKSSKESVWRYPVIVEGGVKALGLDGIDGLSEFAVNIARRLDKSASDLLNYVGIAILVVGLVSGVGTVLAVVDIAAGGISTYLTYLQERERQFAAKSSAFLLDDKKFASSYGYGGTALGAAFLLVGMVSLLRHPPGVGGPSRAANVPPPRQASDVRALEGQAQKGSANSIKGADSKEQAVQRGLTSAPEVKAPQPTPPTVQKKPTSASGLLSAQSLDDQLKAVEQQIERLHGHPDAPVLQRDLEYIRMWANRGREPEARELLKGLTKRVEVAELSRDRGVFDRAYESNKEAPEAPGESTELDQIRDRPPGVPKSQSKLWARVRGGEEVNLTGFKNPPGERLRIDPKYRPPDRGGLTNRELAREGNSCYLNDGQRIELHHRDQDPFGPLDEHSEGYHRYVGSDPDFHPEFSDPGYESWRRYYAVFEGKRRSLAEIYDILRERYWKGRFK